MNPPDQPLSLELLDAALLSALSEPHLCPFQHLLLNETRWRSVVEGKDLTGHRGLLVSLVHPDQLDAILKAAFVSNYGFCDYSAFLTPAGHYDQTQICELDFGFENTKKVEAALNSGLVVVQPCDGEYQYWYTAKVLKGPGYKLLDDLIAPHDYHGHWHLREDIRIDIRDGDMTIVAAQKSSQRREITELLMERYGVVVDASNLRKRADKLLADAIKHEQRAARFEIKPLLPAKK